MAAYEDMLVLVMHDAPAFLGCQSIKAKIYRDLEFEMEISVPVTPYSELKWFGFSQEGNCFYV